MQQPNGYHPQARMPGQGMPQQNLMQTRPIAQPRPPMPHQPHGTTQQHPVQINKRPQESESFSKHIKKKRPTDRNMPPKIDAFVPESKLYTELCEFEKKLDASIMRLDVQEAVGRPSKVCRTLRVFISNTSDQASSSNADDESALDLNNDNAPSWTLKIEGRLLDPATPTKKAQPIQKFTSFFKSIKVELHRDPGLHPEGNIIEWIKDSDPNKEHSDGIEIKRKGDTNVNATIILEPFYDPPKYKLNPELSSLLDIKLETLPQIIITFQNYVMSHKLQREGEDAIQCNLSLQDLFKIPNFKPEQIPDLIRSQLLPPDPIVLNYTIRVDKEFHQSPKAYDVDVELDSVRRQKLNAGGVSTQAQKEIMALDDKIVQCVQSINNSKIKRDFLMQFAEHPVEFINKWIASQARDLEVILGESKVNLEEMRQSDFYKQTWVKEAVFHYLTVKTQQRLQKQAEQQIPRGPMQ